VVAAADRRRAASSIRQSLSTDSEIVQKEVFGPVITVQRADDADQAIAFANDTVYGLASSVFTRDVGRAMDARRRLEFCCGGVHRLVARRPGADDPG
jgi:aminobutyraldehyde dehydrogenase